MTSERPLGGALLSIALAVAAAGCRQAPPEPPREAAGGCSATIVVPARASDTEKTAAVELARYLEQACATPFRIVPEGDAPAGRRIFVGATAPAAAAGISPDTLASEEWVARSVGPDLVLGGGSPRATLYAVHHFLEDEVGVRWWNAFEDDVPRIHRIPGPIDRKGKPVFAYRDCQILDGPRIFCARSRLNGSATGLTPDAGGEIEIGPREHPVHNLYHYVPPDRYFPTHPEYFSEVKGIRVRQRGQLCLSNPHVLYLVVRAMRASIVEAEQRARFEGSAPPTIFDVSPNDWGGWCECARCAAVVRREGRSGQWLAFVNRIADDLRRDRPDMLVSTLAYYTTFHAPKRERARDSVVVRFSGLQWRDFSRSLLEPENAAIRRELLRWRKAAARLWIWDYAVTYGNFYELPLPVLRNLARDLRFYAEQGVEGVFFQTDYPVSSDMRDLKVWALLKLIEDPERDPDSLVLDFTYRYYGPAGASVRAYLDGLEKAVRAHPGVIRMEPDPWDYLHLDLRFFREASESFEAALRAVDGRPVEQRRVRHARLSLDRALLAQWPDLEEEAAARDVAAAFPFRLREVLDRCRNTWQEQLVLRASPGPWSAGAAGDNVPDCGWSLGPRRD